MKYKITTAIIVFSLLSACSVEKSSTDSEKKTQKLEESTSQETPNVSHEEKNAVIQGYIVRKDNDTIRVMDDITKEEIMGKNHQALESHLRKHYDSKGYIVDLNKIDEEKKATLHIGQKVTVVMDWIYLTLPGSGTALKIKIEEE